MVKKDLSPYRILAADAAWPAVFLRGAANVRGYESCAEWTHWPDRQVAWSELCLAVAEARTSVKVYAHWLTGGHGEQLVAVLRAAANRGVRIQILAAQGVTSIDLLRSSGLVVRCSSRLVNDFDGPMVVDDRGAYLAWHDGLGEADYPRLIRLFGPAAAAMGHLFNVVWEQAGGHPVMSAGLPFVSGAQAIPVVLGGTEPETAHADLLGLLSNARRRLDVCLDDWGDRGIADALYDAALRGVVVRCVVWSGSTSRLDAAARLTLERLRGVGVAIRIVQVENSSAGGGKRLVVVDGQHALWGFRPLSAQALALPGLAWLMIEAGQGLQHLGGLFTELWRAGAWLEPLSVLARWQALAIVVTQRAWASCFGRLAGQSRAFRMLHLMRVAPGRWRVIAL